ncbi:hypothetical protein AB1N83_011306 [Pleurotus pulmonarius]
MSTSDSVCGILLIACLDVLTGVCVDFVSLRHNCTEHLCSPCTWPTKAEDDLSERDPLIPPGRSTQPSPQPHMEHA